MSTIQWFEDDNFWLNFREMMFDPDRMERTPLDVEQMIALCSLRPKMAVLDHCCGFGRHALEFAKRGYSVTGVDLCQSYLEVANAKSSKRQLAVQWVNSDVRTFNRPNYYHFVYNFFTSFGYIEDSTEELTVVTNIYNSLKKGGKFLIDVEGKETLARSFVESQWFDGQDGSIMLVEAKIIDNWSRVQNRWGYIKDNQYHEKIFAHKLYSAWEMGELLNRAGFSYIEFFGNLGGSLYNQDAERMIVLAVKE